MNLILVFLTFIFSQSSYSVLCIGQDQSSCSDPCIWQSSSKGGYCYNKDKIESLKNNIKIINDIENCGEGVDCLYTRVNDGVETKVQTYDNETKIRLDAAKKNINNATSGELSILMNDSSLKNKEFIKKTFQEKDPQKYQEALVQGLEGQDVEAYEAELETPEQVQQYLDDHKGDLSNVSDKFVESHSGEFLDNYKGASNLQEFEKFKKALDNYEKVSSKPSLSYEQVKKNQSSFDEYSKIVDVSGKDISSKNEIINRYEDNLTEEFEINPSVETGEKLLDIYEDNPKGYSSAELYQKKHDARQGIVQDPKASSEQIVNTIEKDTADYREQHKNLDPNDYAGHKELYKKARETREIASKNPNLSSEQKLDFQKQNLSESRDELRHLEKQKSQLIAKDPNADTSKIDGQITAATERVKNDYKALKKNKRVNYQNADKNIAKNECKKGKACKLYTPTMRLIAAGVMAGMSGIVWGIANKELQRIERNIENLEKIRDKIKGLTADDLIQRCSQNDYEDSSKPQCYCFDPITRRANSSRDPNGICASVFPHFRRLDLATNREQIRGCVTQAGNFDLSCKCRGYKKGSKSCHKTTTLSFPGLGRSAKGLVAAPFRAANNLNRAGAAGASTFSGDQIRSLAKFSKKVLDKKLGKNKNKVPQIIANEIKKTQQNPVYRRLGENLSSGSGNIGKSLAALPAQVRNQIKKSSPDVIAKAENAYKRARSRSGKKSGFDDEEFELGDSEELQLDAQNEEIIANKKYDYKDSDIYKRSGASIFKVISSRYYQSAYNKLFEETK